MIKSVVFGKEISTTLLHVNILASTNESTVIELLYTWGKFRVVGFVK